MTSIIREHKRHYNKPDQVFECEKLYQDKDELVLRYVTGQDYTIAGRPIPAGSSTLGLYRQGREWVFWKMLRPDDSLEGYLAHLCEPVDLRADEVIYRDLMLDIWQTPPEPPTLLDEDDLAAALAAGQVSQELANRTLALARNLMSRFDQVVANAERTLTTRLGI